MKKLYVTKNLGDRGYQIESEDGRYVNRISHEALLEISKKSIINGHKVLIINNLENEEDEEPIIMEEVTIEEYENGFDVIVTRFELDDNSDNMYIKILDEYTKTYKKESTAIKYADKVKKELEYLRQP